MAALEARFRDLGCAKINLQIRSSNASVIDFYEQLGYTVDDVICMGKRLERDDD
jgi:ribosomal protein S18 acetylase RimI-like enzyme